MIVETHRSETVRKNQYCYFLGHRITTAPTDSIAEMNIELKANA
ncbi:hypothetical protein [Prevotella aurantiaca]